MKSFTRLRLTMIAVLMVCFALMRNATAEQPAVEIKARHGQSWRGMIDGLPVLMLRGSHRERGEAHGKLAGKEIIRSCDQLASQIAKRLPGGWDGATSVAKLYQMPLRYREELTGMLAGIELVTTPAERELKVSGRAITIDDLTLLNTTDVFELFRCSQFSAWGTAAAGGQLIVGRNFDYPPILPRENFCVLAFEPTEKELRPTLDALFFGFIGRGITAIRDDGLYIAPNTGGPSPRAILSKEPIASGFVLRTFLETAKPSTAIDELTAQLKSHFALPILLHVVPPKSEFPKQTPVIVEFEPSATAPRVVVRQPETGVPSLFVANHHVRNAADLEKGRCGILKRECEKCVAAGKPIDFAAARTILHAARQDQTYVSSVCWPHEGRLKVAIAEPGKVATESRFYEVDWQAIVAAR